MQCCVAVSSIDQHLYKKGYFYTSSFINQLVTLPSSPSPTSYWRVQRPVSDTSLTDQRYSNTSYPLLTDPQAWHHDSLGYVLASSGPILLNMAQSFDMGVVYGLMDLTHGGLGCP